MTRAAAGGSNRFMTAWLEIAGGLGRAGAAALDVLLPPRCIGCGAGVGGQGTLCPACWREIDFIAGPCCTACGLPFDYDFGDDGLCGACARRRPPYGRACAAVVYTDASRRLVLDFKRGDRTDAAPVLARWMARAGAGLLEKAEVIVPVPLHRRRLIARRYNQSALLALAIGRLAGLPVAVDLLRRVRPTRSQGGLSRAARRRNVQGAFALRLGAQDRLAGRRVLLVDDVMTTGATVEACARTLRRGGSGTVDVLALARVVPAGGSHV